MSENIIISGELAERLQHKAMARVELPDLHNRLKVYEYSRFIVVGFKPETTIVPEPLIHCICRLPHMLIAMSAIKETIMQSFRADPEEAKRTRCLVKDILAEMLREIEQEGTSHAT